MNDDKGQLLDEMQKHVKELRLDYINANLRQRYLVARDRLQYVDSGPNRLIQHVSAVEGFARAVAMNFAVNTGRESSREKAYARLWKEDPVKLIKEHIAPKIQQEPEAPRGPVEIFGEEDWELFKLAVQYRNLLVHEATYLRVGFTDKFIEVCERVFVKLAEIAGIPPTT